MLTPDTNLQDVSDALVPNWGADAPRGGKAVMNRILKEKATPLPACPHSGGEIHFHQHVLAHETLSEPISCLTACRNTTGEYIDLGRQPMINYDLTRLER